MGITHKDDELIRVQSVERAIKPVEDGIRIVSQLPLGCMHLSVEGHGGETVSVQDDGQVGDNWAFWGGGQVIAP